MLFEHRFSFNPLKSQKAIFRKSQNLLTKQAPWRQRIQNINLAIHAISMVGYVTAVLAFVCGELPARRQAVCEF